MTLNEKLQALRKQKNLTQEEVAQALYVSRTAVSKWESGRGYPNIESLKALAKFYGVTVDELLSGEELLDLAEETQRERENHLRDMVYGSLDISAALLLFLPVMGQRGDGGVREVSLLSLTGVQPYLRAAYFVLVIGMILAGIFTFALQSRSSTLWIRSRRTVSVLWHIAGVILFTVSLQAYAAVFLFVLLAVKVLLLLKKP